MDLRSQPGTGVRLLLGYRERGAAAPTESWLTESKAREDERHLREDETVASRIGRMAEAGLLRRREVRRVGCF
jgi:hypothetical protein